MTAEWFKTEIGDSRINYGIQPLAEFEAEFVAEFYFGIQPYDSVARKDSFERGVEQACMHYLACYN